MLIYVHCIASRSSASLVKCCMALHTYCWIARCIATGLNQPYVFALSLFLSIRNSVSSTSWNCWVFYKNGLTGLSSSPVCICFHRLCLTISNDFHHPPGDLSWSKAEFWPLVSSFSFLSELKHTHISTGRWQPDRFRFCNHYTWLYKLLLSTFALADTQDASCYKLFTCFISILSLRYSHSLHISEG